MNSAVPKPMLPSVLNLGCGADFQDGAFNIDRNPLVASDAVLDIAAVAPGRPLVLDTLRFGRVRLAEGAFERIAARNVLQQVADLGAALEACLYLLRDGGVLEIQVPYDLSFDAWADPANVRAFNERTFRTICALSEKAGEAFFELSAMNFIPSAYGAELSKAGLAVDDVTRQPRAVDALAVTLRKSAPAVSSGAARIAPPPAVRAAVSAPPPVRAVSPPPSVRSAAPPEKPAAQPVRRVLTPFAGGWEAHRDRHCIWIVTPPGYVHSQAFSEVAEALQGAFEALGGSAPVVTDPAGFAGRAPIVYGAMLLPPEAGAHLPPDSVIVNLEQVSDDSEWMSGRYFELLQSFPVLDYSPRNRDRLAERGIAHARALEIGYSERLTRIEPDPVRDIDVLFYGSLNKRRADLLDALRARGLKVVHLFGVYGEERDEAIGRAKVVLNVHHYEPGVFEIVRVSYLLANRVCVVTEGEADDPDLTPLAGGLEVVPYEELAQRCADLVADEERRARVAEEGFRLMSARPQSAFLKALVDEATV